MSERKNFRRTHLDGRKLHPSTQMMSYGYDPALSEGAVKPPVFLTSTFEFQSAEEGADFFDVASGRKPISDDQGVGGLVYSRFNHPNIEIVEDRLALFDEAECGLLTASGMAAISAIFLSLCGPGDTVIHYTPLYGGTEALLGKVMPEWGVKATPFSDGLSEEALLSALEEAARSGPVRMIYLETPANPTNAIVDLQMVRRVADKWSITAGLKPVIVCDNTLLGPVFQNPLAHGADINVYSLTKYVGGHSDLIAGGITGSKEFLAKIRQTRGAFGFQLDPHSSWMLARSLETLTLRMERAAQSATRIAEWLADNSIIPCKVLHPEFSYNEAERAVYDRQCSGPGSTFSFVVENDRALAFRILNALELFKLAVSLGGTESLVCHPTSTTHSGMPVEARESVGLSEGLIRVSIGLEDADDLITDLSQAFRRAVASNLSLSA